MTRRTVVGLSIPADQSQPLEVVTVDVSLPGVRQWVGKPGTEPYLEAIALGGDTYMWVDEDGRMADLPANPRASRLAAGRVLGGDALVGDVLILGATPDGDEASLTVDTLARLQDTLGVPVPPLYRTEAR